MNNSNSQIWLGSILIAVGVGIMLHALNIFDLSHFIAMFWPLAIITAGIVSIINNPKTIATAIPLVVIAFGILFQLNRLDILDFNIGALIWPSIIILFGLSLIINRINSKKYTTDENHVNLFAMFAGIETKNTSQNFMGGTATAMLGGIELDLREAIIKDKAELNLNATLGGLELRVPENWHIDMQGTSILGGWENKANKTNGQDAPVLTIKGSCLMGGVEIKN